MTYEKLISNITNKVNFSFSRFGDGELNCMYGKSGSNCDGHHYFTDLGVALNKAWDNPKGIVAVQRYGYEMYKDRLGENYWADADILHRASINGEINQFCEALYGRYVIMVGPAHLEPLKWIDKLVYVPKKNAWLSYTGIKAVIKCHLPADCVVLYCCGMMAEVLIHELYDPRLTMIDVGSALDPYCNVKSRTYHHKLKL